MSAIIEKYIPEEDYDSIYSTNISSAFSPHSQIEKGHYPCGRFFYLQREQFKITEGKNTFISDAFEKANPKWIISDMQIDSLGFVTYKSRYEPVEKGSDPQNAPFIYKRREMTTSDTPEK